MAVEKVGRNEILRVINRAHDYRDGNTNQTDTAERVISILAGLTSIQKGRLNLLNEAVKQA